MDLTAQLELLGEIVVAMILGGVLGIERQMAEKPAGVRTHMLVSGAAALLVGAAAPMVHSLGEDAGPSLVRADPLRTMSVIITGVSFLGGGTIIRSRTDHVGGLTTAATVLLASAIGMSTALHQWLLAAGTALPSFTVLRLKALELRLERGGASAPSKEPR